MIDSEEFPNDAFAGSGQEEHFLSWLAQLQGKTEQRIGPIEEWQMLLQNTTGEANVMAVNNLSSALDRTYFELQSKFGTPAKVAESLIRRMNTFPEIKSGDLQTQLLQLSYLCRKVCLYQARVPGLLGHLDSEEGVGRIIAKLPETLRRSWAIRKSLYKFSHQLSNPPFAEVLDFVDKVAKSCIVEIETIDMPVDKTECVIQGHYNHLTADCRTFCSFSIPSRRRVLKVRGACFRCFGRHFVYNCTSLNVCWKCKSTKHHTLLHIDGNQMFLWLDD